MERLLISIDKILKSVQNMRSEDLAFDTVFSVFVSMFDVELVFADCRGNVFKKSKREEINSLRFDLKKSFLNGIDNGINKITELKYYEYFIPDYMGFIMPIIFAERYLGALFIYSEEELSDECIICLKSVSLFISTITFSIERDFERKKSENREIIRGVFGTLSYSEFEAVIGVFSGLKDTECVLVMKQISQKLNITRSVIFNAIKKIESAGIIESRSLGMKGTYIKILNSGFLEEIQKFDKN